MRVGATAIVQRQDNTEPKARLKRAEGLGVHADASEAQEPILAGRVLVELSLAGDFKDGNELLHSRNWQDLMLNRIAERTAVLEGMGAAFERSCAEQHRVTDH